MEVIDSKSALREQIRKALRNGRSIGFVPTMGFLHDGHLSLIRRARQENDMVVVSVFVNPTQFGPNEDLDAYPRDTERDIEMIRAEKADIAFFPSVQDMYPEAYETYVQVEGPMTQTLCGRSRPTHFKGVTTVVAKLFNLVRPHRAYFGQKDAQQAAVIGKMVRDLDFDLELVICPIVRETDGLAMSSRNTYLSDGHRSQATVLSKALFKARSMIEAGERNAGVLIESIRTQISREEAAQIDYVAIADTRTLESLEVLEGNVLVAVAVKFGRTRLIDNIMIEV